MSGTKHLFIFLNPRNHGLTSWADFGRNRVFVEGSHFSGMASLREFYGLLALSREIIITGNQGVKNTKIN